MYRVVIRDVKEHFGRFVMTIFAVALGVAFLSGTLAFRDVLASTFSSITESSYTEDIYIYGKVIENAGETMNTPIDSGVLAKTKQVSGIKYATDVYYGQAYVFNADGVVANTSQAPAMGYSFDNNLADKIITGRAPKADEVLLEKATAYKLGVKAGDTVTIVVNSPQQMKVSGTFTYGQSLVGASIASFSRDTSIKLFGDEPVAVTVLAADGVDVKNLKQRIVNVLGNEYTVKTKAESKKESAEIVDKIIRPINTFLLLFVSVALGISIFIITNTFTISVRQRQKQYALLRAIGAKSRQVFFAVIVQAIIVGLVGSLLGIAFGQVLILGIRALLGAVGMELGGSLIIATPTIIKSIIAGIIFTCLAAILPSRKAALIPPLEAMRQSSGAKEKSLVLRTVFALLLLTGGSVLLYLGADGKGKLLSAGVLFLIIAVVLLAPALVAIVSAVFGYPLRKIAPVTGVLASRSLKATPRKTATTAMALAIGITLVSAGSTIAASLQGSIHAMITDTVSADLVATPMSFVKDPSVGAQMIRDTPGVAKVDDSLRMGLVADANAEKETYYSVGTYSKNVFQKMGFELLEGSDSAFQSGNAIVVRDYAKSHNWKIGQKITVAGMGEPVTLIISGFTNQDNPFIGLPIRVTPQDLQKIKPFDLTGGVFIIDVAEGADIAKVKADVTKAVKSQYLWTVYDQQDIKNQASGQINTLLTVFYGLLALSVIIAILGVINTLTLSISDRVREIGLLRAVGLQRRGIKRMILQESIMITLFGAIVGISLGIPVGLATIKFMLQDATVRYVIPWNNVSVMLLVAFIVGIFAAIFPARRGGKINILEAIAED